MGLDKSKAVIGDWNQSDQMVSPVVYSNIKSTSTFGKNVKTSIISAFLAFTSSKRTLILSKRS